MPGHLSPLLLNLVEWDFLYLATESMLTGAVSKVKLVECRKTEKSRREKTGKKKYGKENTCVCNQRKQEMSNDVAVTSVRTTGAH